jgi:tetratricopeptide (TPR) repeat protein
MFQEVRFSVAEGGMIDKLLGNDEFEELEIPEAAQLVLTADTVATIVAMDTARFNSNLSLRAADYLDRQGVLTSLAIKHFDEERRLAIKAAKRKGISDRMRIASQLFLAFIPLFIVAGVAFLIYGAVTSHTVIVDAFQSPSALTPTGVTGRVVAAGILDELQKLQAATRTVSGSQLATKSAWSSEVKIEIPDTGVSLEEVDRLLRERLGHDIHIDGDLVQTPMGGLALTVRGDDVLPETFDGAAGDLNKITTQAAEYIYGRSQPYEYVCYLQNHHRDAESLEFLPGALRRAKEDFLRSRLALGWGNSFNNLNRPAEALVKWRLADSLQPNYWTARTNIVLGVLATMGEEAGWLESRSMLEAVAAAPKKDRPRVSSLGNSAGIMWDIPLELEATLDDASKNNGDGAGSLTMQPQLAIVYAQLHDEVTAARYLALSDPRAAETEVAVHQSALTEATDRNDPASAVADADALWKVWMANSQVQSGDDGPCVAVLALGMAGRTKDADAILQHLGPWSRCTAAHGQILDHQGDLPGAMAAWADGIAHTPDLPADYMARGLSEENHGDMKAAEADFAKATTNAPHFADPFKDYGDLLAREGRWKEALAKYDEALKYAPNWATLHQARDEAARKT